jgi:uncharacterized membrane protein
MARLSPVLQLQRQTGEERKQDACQRLKEVSKELRIDLGSQDTTGKLGASMSFVLWHPISLLLFWWDCFNRPGWGDGAKLNGETCWGE